MADELSEAVVFMLDEANLIPQRDNMLRAGFTPEQVIDACATVVNADTVEEGLAAINQPIQAAEFEQWKAELTERGRNEEIQRIADAYRIPFATAKACVDADEARTDLLKRLAPIGRTRY